MDALGTGAVRLGQVGDGELALLGKARVAVLRQRLLPVPDPIAAFNGRAKLIIQTDLGNTVDIAQTLLQLMVRVAQQAALKGGDDLGLLHAQATRPAHPHDKRDTKFGVVGSVESLDFFKLGRRALRQPRLALLVG